MSPNYEFVFSGTAADILKAFTKWVIASTKDLRILYLNAKGESILKLKILDIFSLQTNRATMDMTMKPLRKIFLIPHRQLIKSEDELRNMGTVIHNSWKKNDIDDDVEYKKWF